VNIKINPKTQNNKGRGIKGVPNRVPNQENTLIPVGTAIIIVAALK
jgi:hypothetical protein